jgi:hypothetical protein
MDPVAQLPIGGQTTPRLPDRSGIPCPRRERIGHTELHMDGIEDQGRADHFDLVVGAELPLNEMKWRSSQNLWRDLCQKHGSGDRTVTLGTLCRSKGKRSAFSEWKH